MIIAHDSLMVSEQALSRYGLEDRFLILSKHDYQRLTLTSDLYLQSQPILGQGQPSCKNQGQRSNGSQTDKQRDRWMETSKSIILLLR